MNRAKEEVCIQLLDHLCFKPLTELLFPAITVFCRPFTPRFSHFPISTNERVSRTVWVITAKLVSKTKRDLLEFFSGLLHEEMPLPQSCQLARRPS